MKVITSVLALIAVGSGCAPGPAAPDSKAPSQVTTAALSSNSLVREAESFSAGQGVTLYQVGLSYVDSGDWVSYDDVDFGAAGTYGTFVARLGTTHAGNRVRVHLDSLDGPVVATLATTATGGFTTMIEQEAPLGQVSGVHDVFVEFDGTENNNACQQQCFSQSTPQCPAALERGCGFGIGNFDWFAFSPSAAPTITLFVSPTSIFASEIVTIGAQVLTASGAPITTGYVQFSGIPRSSVTPLPLDAEGKTFFFGFGIADVGTHPITAQYLGSEGLAPVSDSVTITVAQANTETVVTLVNSEVAPDELVTYRLQTNSVLPGGNGTDLRIDLAEYACFLDEVAFPCSSTPSDSGPGVHTVRFDFLGNANFAPSSGSATYTRL